MKECIPLQARPLESPKVGENNRSIAGVTYTQCAMCFASSSVWSSLRQFRRATGRAHWVLEGMPSKGRHPAYPYAGRGPPLLFLGIKVPRVRRVNGLAALTNLRVLKKAT
jgi:hypothetical protein